MRHLADVVSIAFGLQELRDVRRQRVFLMDLLKSSLVEQLQENIGECQESATSYEISLDQSKNKNNSFNKNL